MSIKSIKYSSLENSIVESQNQKLFEVQYLVIAGGGSGNRGGNNYSGNQGSGGGGSGGYLSSVPGELSGTSTTANEPLQVEIGKDYKCKVGAGASNIYGEFANGGTSVFDGVVAVPGGGGGGIGFTNSFQAGGSGGSAGGGASGYSNGRHFINQGGRPGQNSSGSGGGGASDSDGQRVGGDGLPSTITGSSVTRAGGGGGRHQNSNTNYAGGAGGGGQTGNASSHGAAGTVNTGSGGGAGGNGNGNNNRGSGGLGGSGVVILRYPKKYTITVGVGLTAGTETVDGADKYIEITAGSDNVSWA